MKKHAYLIITHNNFYVLDKVLRLIDDERNDIYIHVDKKVHNFNFSKYKQICKKSNVIYTKKRYNVKWGNSSQVKTEITLFFEAYKVGYDYYHLLSGADMPIKSQDYIHNFFQENKFEFLEIAPGTHEKYKFRLNRYHLDLSNPILRKLQPYAEVVQNILNVNRLKNCGLKIYKGSNWASLSHQGVGLLLQNKKRIIKMTRFSLCADEIYKQTIILNSKLADTVYPHKDIRLIDWVRHEGESPHTFTIDDFEMIKSSQCLFARKFIAGKDKEIIDRVFCMVSNEQNK